MAERLPWPGRGCQPDNARYKDADKVVQVMDQLNIHFPASIYEAFRPELTNWASSTHKRTKLEQI